MGRLLGEGPLVGAYSALAQLVEQLTVNQRVAGSSPAGGANFSPRSLGQGDTFLVSLTSMRVRAIGKSGILASVVGFGATGIQETPRETNDSDEKIVNTIHAAKDKGVTLIDTAPSYGWGLAGGGGPDRVCSEDDFRNDAADWLPWFRIENRRRQQGMFSGWRDLTEKYECSIGNISTAWTLGQPGVTHVLLGSRNTQQAISSAYACSNRLEQEDMKRIDADLVGLGSPT